MSAPGRTSNALYFALQYPRLSQSEKYKMAQREAYRRMARTCDPGRRTAYTRNPSINPYAKLRVRVFKCGIYERYVLRAGDYVVGAQSLQGLLKNAATGRWHRWPDYDLARRWVE